MQTNTAVKHNKNEHAITVTQRSKFSNSYSLESTCVYRT